MKIEQRLWTPHKEWTVIDSQIEGNKANLVLYFGNWKLLETNKIFNDLRDLYPNAHLVGCSTSGEIIGTDVFEDSTSLVAIQFEKTKIKVAYVPIDNNSFAAGVQIAQALKASDLYNIFILSDGLSSNGSDLLRGTASVLNKDIKISGGLAGDSMRYVKTYVGCDCSPRSGYVAAIGFYGDSLSVSHGNMGGWTTFGAERMVTKSKGNVLYELDKKPALQLYKDYLGEDAKNLPQSGLLFPLSIRPANSPESALVRTVIDINEREQSITFAGDIPEGFITQLMHGSFNHLVDGAEGAASMAAQPTNDNQQLAILVSCVGRKALMGQRIADEVEAVKSILGEKSSQVGFYSYGEISPHFITGNCELHNQTMTITTFVERA